MTERKLPPPGTWEWG